MRNWLADFGYDTWNLSQILSNFLHHFGVQAAQRLSHYLDFTHVDAGRMFIQFCAAGSSRRRNNLARSMQNFFDGSADPIRLLQRSTRRQRDIDVQRALVERRQELTT